ncbi:MAG TPA: ribonuclease E/G, partial [Rubrivivax sp.]|nr:ribonuclease E/G [Rubrivivax sp.]
TTPQGAVEVEAGVGVTAGDADREGKGRRRRRGGRDRGEGRGEEASAGNEGVALQPAEGDLAAATVTEGATAEAPAAAEGAAETGERASRGRRRGRGRDRAREEDDSVVAAEAAAVDTAGPAWAAAAVPADEAAQAMLTPVVAPETAAALPARSQALPVTPPPTAQPIRIEAYDLPTDDLRALARSAGLEWVLSDAEKIRAVQAAMAAEPAPVRVPREPRRQVLVDEGPLVLVETKKDLSQLKLPFEQNAG